MVPSRSYDSSVLIRLLRAACLILSALPALATSAAAQVKAVKCRDCHPAIYAEWRESQHARAYRDPRFQAAMKAAQEPQSCIPCHAPNPILDVGLGKYPETRRRYKTEGVTCVTCHAKGDAYAGPYAGKDMDDVGHYSTQDKAFKTHQLCATCHGQEKEQVHNQVRDFLKSDAFKRGKHCQDCHMERIVRPAAVDSMGKVTYKKRPGRKHGFKGSHDADMLQSAAKLEVKVSGRTATITVTNVEAGHAIPAAADRVLRLEVTAGGKPLKIEVWDWAKRIQEKKSRSATFDLPTGSGKVQVTLWHCHKLDAAREEWAAMRTAAASYR
jgi:hypothetical protein